MQSINIDNRVRSMIKNYYSFVENQWHHKSYQMQEVQLLDLI